MKDYKNELKVKVDLGENLRGSIPGLIKKVMYKTQYLEIQVEKKNLLPVLRFLKESSKYQCTMLLDIVLHISTYVENNGIIETTSGLFESSVWLEREIWDMFGIYFEKHPDLRRILTDYGFVGYPLKKDFPITGYLEVYYDVADKKIIYKPIELMQEYRNYNFGAVWGDYERKVYLENIIK
ncbi:hypothetical protein ACTFIU_006406 [Dictyostelium citrinum]